MVWFGVVFCSVVWFGVVWCGSVWLCLEQSNSGSKKYVSSDLVNLSGSNSLLVLWNPL